MMKLSASPGRADKYPPPLVRFMKTNVGSRSRGRSRSSPMFLRRKVAAGEEPSSPKVTCMGQVRARRSETRPTGTNRAGSARRRCWWVRRALFCGGKVSLRPDFGKWVLFFRFRKAETNRDCAEIEEEPRQRERVGGERDGDEEEAEVSVSSSSINHPPINALLLTRSRSAPYRSSSLASKFWGSPLRSDETEEQEQGASKTEQFSGAGDGKNTRPTSETDPISVKSGQKPRIDSESEEKLGLFDEFEGSITETKLKTGEPAGAGGVAGDCRRQSPTSETYSIPGKSDQDPKTGSETGEKSVLFSKFETGEFSGAGVVDGDGLRPEPTSETGSNPLKSVQNPKKDAENDEKLGLFSEFETGEFSGAGDGLRPEPTSETGSNPLKSGQNPRTDDEKSGLFEEFGTVHPLLLTRCKSEPARPAGEKLSPEMSFWRLRRFGVL